MTDTIKTDVLVVGGGGAGARAAIEADAAGAGTILAVKGQFGIRGLRGSGATSHNATVYGYFPSPASRVSNRDEEREAVYQRIIQCGLGLTDRRLARVLVEDGEKALEKLFEWGVVLPGFEWPTLGEISRDIDPRIGLANQIRGKTDINVLQHTMVTDLIIEDGKCVGAMAVDESSGEPLVIESEAVILATGGEAQLYRFNRHPSCVTGDGYAMGYNAGAELMNMEFIYTNIGTAYPNNFNISCRVWKELPNVRNTNGEEFIHNYLPEGVPFEECMKARGMHNPTSARDIGKYVDIAITKEIKAGRVNEHGACYLDAAAFRKVLSQNNKDWLAYMGVDITGQNLEITMIFHCSHGGLRVDENGQTTIPGLYAVGETASGMHGADRLGGAMMAACQVFGRRAGMHAAAQPRTNTTVKEELVKEHLNRITGLKESKGTHKTSDAMKALKISAWQNLLSIRNEEGVKQSLQQIQEIHNTIVPELSIESAAELVQALELENLLQVGEILARTVLMRPESRGTHYREEFPEMDDENWARAITVRKANGEMTLGTRILDEEWAPEMGDFGASQWA